MRDVSIVIDNYNYAQYVGEAIESALAQTHPWTEVIVVDDGSTDESRLVIERYGSRVRTIFKPNGGQASAFNAGFAASTGQIVIFLDADDLLLPDTVARVVERFTQQPDIAKVHYRLAIIDELGRRTGACTPASAVRLSEGDVRHLVLTAPDDIVHPPASGNAYAAWALRKVLPLPEHRPTDADRYLLNFAALVGAVASLDEVGGCYRVHGRNWFATSTGMQLDQIRHTISASAATHDELQRLALRLKLPGADSMRHASVTDLAQRLISMRLEPDCHPIPGDRIVQLGWSGIVTALRRPGLAWRRRALYSVWFAAMVAAPAPVSVWLAGRLMDAWATGTFAVRSAHGRPA